MYYPYFRGKQFELIAIRESAELIAGSGIVPIIEPVRESLNGLEKTLRTLVEAESETVVVINPGHGDHKTSGDSITALLRTSFGTSKLIRPGILLTSDTSESQALALIDDHRAKGTTLIHSGFTGARSLAENIENDASLFCNVFLDDHSNLLYQKYFGGRPKILVRDGFEQMKNADYQYINSFSDLHITYPLHGMEGYGDFLTVGDNYSEGGGPAYAVAIHLTFIDPDQDNAMFIYHFKSDTNDTPTDPAGKFSQALDKLVATLNSGNSNLLETSAIAEFRDLHTRRHFPGLGYVKKLSIKHHIETLASYQEGTGSV